MGDDITVNSSEEGLQIDLLPCEFKDPSLPFTLFLLTGDKETWVPFFFFFFFFFGFSARGEDNEAH